MKLTKNQDEAVRSSGKNVLVSAGAGTGKTRVLVEKFLYLAAGQQVPVTEILALTFTEKAANEMKSRIFERLGQMGMENARRDLESAYVSTFHAFAARLLKEHPIEAGVHPDFRVIEAEESDFLKEQALDLAIENQCLPASQTFDLLRVYGEEDIRKGLMTLLGAARHEGKTLEEFFIEAVPKPWAVSPPRDLFEKLGEKKLASEWEEFEKIPVWDWKTVEKFKAWVKSFSRRGSKDTRTAWKEIVERAGQCLESRIEVMTLPWRQKLESLGLVFEKSYESLKGERGFLDFDDLQMRVLGLFRGKSPVCRNMLKRYQSRFHYILVDEFQDTNPLQLELIKHLSRKDNLFLVGDYKQSIYAFRGAEPGVFLGMEREYESGQEGIRIPLSENFRCEQPILTFVNSFFRNLWAEDGLAFEDLTAHSREESGRSSVEWLISRREEGESLDHARMREASVIAGRIASLHEEGIAYGDMAILFQAMTSTGIYEQALKKEGIPYFVVAGRGFYYQPEIRDMMSFLAHLDNPCSDIPLAAVLRSPFFQIHDNALFWLARYAKKGDEWKPLYEGVRQFEGIAEIEEAEKEKLRFYFTVTRELFEEKDRLRLAELLQKISDKTAYALMLLADSQGVRKYANLQKLMNLAREYESHEPLSIQAFLRTVRRLETQEVKESEAQIEAEKSGRVVRLLTIHKAKGLEFPVVFIADLAREGRSPEAGAVIAESGAGYGLKMRNEETLDWEKPCAWNAVYKLKKQKENEEWKRLFYVAATRAKSRLILSGVSKERGEIEKSFYEMASWMDWLMNSPEAVLKNATISEPEGISRGRPRLAFAEKEVFKDLFPGFKPGPVEKIIPSSEKRRRVAAQAQNILAQLDPLEKRSAKSLDLPVSAFAAYQKTPLEYMRVYETGYPGRLLEEMETPKEYFEGDAEAAPADFGTAMHRVLERTDFKNPDTILRGNWRSFFRGMGERQLREASLILEIFMQSPLFQRLRRAKRILRELPFVLNGRRGLVHGVIDLLYEDASGRWHVLDYKTAEGNDAKVKASGYELQMMVYALAVKSILKRPPVSGTLYFLKNQWEYVIPLSDAGMESFAGRFENLQQELIDYRNAKLKIQK